jgi:hypothetical protein
MICTMLQLLKSLKDMVLALEYRYNKSFPSISAINIAVAELQNVSAA